MHRDRDDTKEPDDMDAEDEMPAPTKNKNKRRRAVVDSDDEEEDGGANDPAAGVAPMEQEDKAEAAAEEQEEEDDEEGKQEEGTAAEEATDDGKEVGNGDGAKALSAAFFTAKGSGGKSESSKSDKSDKSEGQSSKKAKKEPEAPSWGGGASVPYAALCDAFAKIEALTKRLEIQKIVTDLLMEVPPQPQPASACLGLPGPASLAPRLFARLTAM